MKGDATPRRVWVWEVLAKGVRAAEVNTKIPPKCKDIRTIHVSILNQLDHILKISTTY